MKTVFLNLFNDSLIGGIFLMTEQLQNELNAIVKTIADTGIASKIILFGSMAQGDASQESDTNLYAETYVFPRDETGLLAYATI